jgi:hypothetical protein
VGVGQGEAGAPATTEITVDFVSLYFNRFDEDHFPKHYKKSSKCFNYNQEGHQARDCSTDPDTQIADAKQAISLVLITVVGATKSPITTADVKEWLHDNFEIPEEDVKVDQHNPKTSSLFLSSSMTCTAFKLVFKEWTWQSSARSPWHLVSTPIRCTKEQIGDMLPLFPGQLVHFSCKYLGVSLSIYKLTKGDLQPLVDVASDWLPTWKVSLMLRTGCTTLVKVTLMTIPIHISLVVELLPLASSYSIASKKKSVIACLLHHV